MTVDVGMNDFEKFIYASMYGFDEELNGLIKKHKKDITVGAALMLAAKNGHVECVELLIPISDPMAERSHALRGAAMYGHIECVKALIPVSDVEKFRSSLYWFEDLLPTLERAEEEIEVEKQRERLADDIGMKMEQAPSKRRRM